MVLIVLLAVANLVPAIGAPELGDTAAGASGGQDSGTKGSKVNNSSSSC